MRLRLVAAQLFVQTSREVAWAEDSVHSRPPAYLLPEIRRSCSSATDCGKNLHGYTSILSVRWKLYDIKSGVHKRAKENRLMLQVVLSILLKTLRRIVILRDCAARKEKGYFWITKRMSYNCRCNMYVEPSQNAPPSLCFQDILQVELDRPAHGPKGDCLHSTRCHEWKHFWWRVDYCTFQTVTNWTQVISAPSFQRCNKHNIFAFF